MKYIKMDCFEVFEDSEDGMFDVHLCYTSTEELAEAAVAISNWPRRYRTHKATIRILDSLEEVENEAS